MDPNLFHLDWERTFEALVGIVLLSFVVERACALILESRWYIRLFEDPRVGGVPGRGEHTGENSGQDSSAAEGSGQPAEPPAADAMPGRLYPVKECLAFLVALGICLFWDFDSVSIMLLADKTRLAGKVITAAVIAGGSKASIKLFHDVLRIRSTAYKERQVLRRAEKGNHT